MRIDAQTLKTIMYENAANAAVASAMGLANGTGTRGWPAAIAAMLAKMPRIENALPARHRDTIELKQPS